MTMRTESSVGDRGAVYEVRVKLSMRIRGVKITEHELAADTDAAVEEFSDVLRSEYPWIGRVYLTGRSNGWLAIEDAKGKATKDALEAIHERVNEARKDFETSIIESYGYEENPKHRRNGSTEDDAREFSRRRNMVGTTIRYMKAGRSFDVVLENRGSELGSRSDTLKRGKVVSSHYFLPPLPDFLKKHTPNRGGDLYADAVARRLELDHHESDLYIRDTPAARDLLAEHGVKVDRYSTFKSDTDGHRWIDVPFEYKPFWEKKARQRR